MVTAPLLQRHLPTKAPEESDPSIKGEGTGSVAFLSYSQTCINKSWVPPLQERPDRSTPPRDGVRGDESSLAKFSPEHHGTWFPSMGACGPGLPDWPWTQVCSVCLERCLVAFQGLPVTEQGMSKAWLGEAVALGVLRRNYLILNSSQNSLILASFVSNAEMPGCHEDFT